MSEDKQIPLYAWNAITNEFWLLGHKIDMVNSPEEFDKFIYDMQQELEFLRKRENKLQVIEQMFKSGRVDLDKLTMIVKE